MPDGEAFEVLPVESYVIHRSLIVDIGAYYGEQADAWDAIEACERALGLPNAPPAPPAIETPTHAFAPPPPGECERAGDGSCMDNPPLASALPGSLPARLLKPRWLAP